MKLLSAVAKGTRVPTDQDPTIGNSIDVILDDGNAIPIRGSRTGPKPKVALVNCSFIPYIPGNGNFVVNTSNSVFRYGPDPTQYAEAELLDGDYTRAEFVEQIGQAIQRCGGVQEALEWSDGLDVRATIENETIKVSSTKCVGYAPMFDDDVYWAAEPQLMVVVGPDSINNASGQAFQIDQRFLGGSFPRCRGVIGGRLQGDGIGDDSFVLNVGDFAGLFVQEGFWNLFVNGQVEVFEYQNGDDFELRVRGDVFDLFIDGELVANVVDENPENRNGEVGVTVKITVGPTHQVDNFLMTTLPAEGTQYFDEMTEITTSWIDWNTEALQTMTGSGTKVVQGTSAVPSVITCSSAPKANSSIGNILVCVDQEVYGSQSGPRSGAQNQFIYTIPNVTQNLDPCTVIAPFLLPITLNYDVDKTLSRLRVQFVSQITGQPVGFTAPANITLAFVD